jgi:hypothetical protein
LTHCQLIFSFTLISLGGCLTVFAVMLPALLITFAALVYRLLFVLAGSPATWANFSPLTSIFLCSAVFLPQKRSVIWPALGVVASDALINAHSHLAILDARMIPGYFCFAISFLLGVWLRRTTRRTFWLLAATVFSSFFFYIVTNTAAWYFDSSAPLAVPLYPKTFEAWLQALTIGHPGFPPTWLFLRHTLLSDLLFTSLFVFGQSLFARKAVSAASDLPRPTYPSSV